MKNYGRVKSTVKPKEMEIDAYSVWLNSDIHEISVAYDGIASAEYEFNQKQYTKDEYIALVDERNRNLENKLTDTQLALCDVYEMIGG